MRFYRLDMPESWGPDLDDATFYCEVEGQPLQVLNYNNRWQKSMMEDIEQVKGYYCFDDEERREDQKWSLREVTEEEVKNATEG